FDIASLSSFQVEDFDDAANAAGTRSARPDDVVVNRIGSSPATLTAGDTDPSAPRNWSAETAPSPATTAAAETAARAGAARTAIRWAVLTIAVNVIWNLVVGRDVIDLAVWQLNPLPT